MTGHLAQAAAADGLPLVGLDELARRPNTFVAHRLLAGALVEAGEGAEDGGEEEEAERDEPVVQELQQRLGLGPALGVLGPRRGRRRPRGA